MAAVVIAATDEVVDVDEEFEPGVVGTGILTSGPPGG